MVRFVALAILLAIAAGVFGFIQMSNVAAAQAQLGAIQAELATAKANAKQYADSSKMAASNLEQCNSQKAEIQTQLDTVNAAMAAKKPAGKK